jgi:hypothetical protein
LATRTPAVRRFTDVASRSAPRFEAPDPRQLTLPFGRKILRLMLVHRGEGSMAREKSAPRQKAVPKKPSLRDLSKLPPDESELGAVWAEINLQSHRAAAVLGGALVEDALQFAIKTHFVYLSRSDEDKLFDYQGPLASFDAKIRVGYAIALYGPVVRNDLDVIRRIRNGFAHARKPITFDTSQVAKEMAKIRYLALVPNEGSLMSDYIAGEPDATLRARYSVLARTLSHKLFVVGLPLGKRLTPTPSLP